MSKTDKYELWCCLPLAEHDAAEVFIASVLSSLKNKILNSSDDTHRIKFTVIRCVYKTRSI